MKKEVFLLITVALFLTYCKHPDQNFISKLIKKNKAYQSLHYKVQQKYYYSNGIDTTFTPYEVWLVKDSTMSGLNAYVWVDNNYRPYHMIYEKGNFYLTIPPKKTTILYKNFTDDFISAVDWIRVFAQTDKFQKLLTDTVNKVSIIDLQYNGKACKKLSIEFPEDSKGNLQLLTFILDDNFVPQWAMYRQKTEDYTYFDELTFSDFSFNKVKLSNLQNKQKQVLVDNPIDTGSTTETAQLENMLHIGDKAPLFDGHYYATKESFKIADFIGENIIIVDFWYTHCPPCVRAMPFLSQLNDEFKDKGLKIFGLNSVDNRAYSLDNLNRFLQKRKLSYDVIMTQPTVDLMYKIKGYPTMYVVDKSGKIAYVEIGFDKDKFKELSAKVKMLLEE